ncbi:uncharacterized protein LY79DRAFT_555645 [Colletotrichum navitas]|uniref:Uncharacterized protein n=1 Tax=Colletotrichum navitas TaxID=681940 RepID=A0AAD8PYM7_9PEZI|nr:uncharacterized protein LY79DRAFT_555645 [Colletotrichum navitas]KAK1590035.1 hypothetical protein LY79DRAFT_555645 [Colletotrichum navitas]
MVSEVLPRSNPLSHLTRHLVKGSSTGDPVEVAFDPLPTSFRLALGSPTMAITHKHHIFGSVWIIGNPGVEHSSHHQVQRGLGEVGLAGSGSRYRHRAGTACPRAGPGRPTALRTARYAPGGRVATEECRIWGRKARNMRLCISGRSSTQSRSPDQMGLVIQVPPIRGGA